MQPLYIYMAYTFIIMNMHVPTARFVADANMCRHVLDMIYVLRKLNSIPTQIHLLCDMKHMYTEYIIYMPFKYTMLIYANSYQSSVSTTLMEPSECKLCILN